MTKELIVLWGLDAWHFEKEFCRECMRKYNHPEYIKKKVQECNPDIMVYYKDFETGETEEVYP